MIFGNSKGFFCRTMLLIIIIGVAIRLVVGSLLTYNYDVFSWALIISNIQEGSGLYDVTGYNYPPVWGHLLAVLGTFTDLFGMDVLAERVPEYIFTEAEIANNPHLAFTTTVEFNILIAGFIALFDILTSYLIYYLIREVFKDERKALIGASIWMLCPFAIAVGSIGPMFDSLSGAMVLLCILLLIKDQEFLAGCVFSVAVLLKLFPAFMIFIFVAYILMKHREEFVRRLAHAVCGAVLFTLVIMLPHLIDGHVIDSLSFILARASTPSQDLGMIVSMIPIVLYLLAIIMEIILARRFVITGRRDLNRDFIFFSLFAAMLAMINPGPSQYILMVAPLLVIGAICISREYKLPLIILFFATTIYVLASSAALLTTTVEYTDLLSFDTWYNFDQWLLDTKLFGMNMYKIIAAVGGWGQYFAVLICYYLLIKHLRQGEGGHVERIDTAAS